MADWLAALLAAWVLVDFAFFEHRIIKRQPTTYSVDDSLVRFVFLGAVLWLLAMRLMGVF